MATTIQRMIDVRSAGSFDPGGASGSLDEGSGIMAEL